MLPFCFYIWIYRYIYETFQNNLVLHDDLQRNTQSYRMKVYGRDKITHLVNEREGIFEIIRFWNNKGVTFCLKNYINKYNPSPDKISLKLSNDLFRLVSLLIRLVWIYNLGQE